ncbi:mevalonate kinase [Kitasatospora sp. NPDC015120]|uniref:mevalonate kinase family protein n=1 Tax=Kitasatospora sp. NPDC015120 TaxID=3364023 RepID=UPI0036F464E1
MGEVAVFAPGSLFVVGEYAVLHGGRALLAAVDSGIECRTEPRADGWWLSAPDLGVDGPPQDVPSHAGAHLLVDAVRAGRTAFPGPGPLRVTVRGHGWGAGRKLGLGTSAASAVAVLGALAATAGHDLSSTPLRRTLLPTAVDVHRAHQHGRGSGADVAASVHGGWVEYCTADGIPRARPAAVPPGLRLAAAWSRIACSTPDAIDRFHRTGGQNEVNGVLDALARELDRFWAAARDANEVAFLRSVRAYGTLLEEMARRLAPPQAAEWMARLTRAAADRGASAKSSGAVGGDCVIALATDGAPLAGARAAWRRLGAVPLDLAPDPHGLRALPPDGKSGTPEPPRTEQRTGSQHAGG